MMEKGIEIKGSNNLEFSEHWNLLHDVISQGEKLREAKPRPSPQEYDVINIEFIKKSKKSYKTCRKCPNSINRYFDENTRCTKPLSMQNFLHRNIYSKLPLSNEEKKPKQKLKTKSKCPLRVMELAEPTKRQCLETLRNKCHSLPDFMLDRLRRQIRDQKPVVQINDAINCFKIKKSCRKRLKTQTKGEHESRSLTEIKYFCAIFGTLIAKRLNKSVRTEDLCGQLQRISEIVYDEIRRIMVGRKNRRVAQASNDHLNLQDAARKVAIWIALILEDSADKMLEEELRELEEEEGPVLDFLDDVLDSVLIICEPHLPEDITSSPSSDHFDDAVDQISLRGEEEVATIEDTINLDALTNYSDNVDIIIAGTTVNATEDTTIDLETKNEPLTEDIVEEMISLILQNTIQSEFENLKALGLLNEKDIVKDPEDGSGTTDKPNLSEKVSESHFTPIKVEDYTENSEVKSVNKTKIQHNFDKDETTNQGNSKNNDEETNEIGASKSVIQDSKSQQDFIKKFLEDTKDIENQGPNDVESKVKDLDNIKGHEKNEFTQEPDKMVKFDENNGHNLEQRKISSSKSREEILHAHKNTIRRLVAHNIGVSVSIQNLSWARSSDHMPPNVQPPNEHLLSDVDEKWPRHVMPYQSSHALDLVKKSVTSLGRIFEQEPYLRVRDSGGSDQIESFIGEFQWIEEGEE